jgi:hypothetical protein
MAEWLKLLDAAVAIIEQAERILGAKIAWTLGGGSALNHMFGHRDSRDVDIFINDPQLLLFITPRVNLIAEQIGEQGSYVESSNFIRFQTPDGEIDFIVAPHLTVPFAEEATVGLYVAMVETPAEILAKKLLYRADSFAARDIFDFAFLIERGEAEKLLQKDPTYLPRMKVVLDRLALHGEALRKAFDQIDTVGYHPTFEHCAELITAFVSDATSGRQRPGH